MIANSTRSLDANCWRFGCNGVRFLPAASAITPVAATEIVLVGANQHGVPPLLSSTLSEHPSVKLTGPIDSPFFVQNILEHTCDDHQ